MTDYIDREELLKAISKIGGSLLSEWDTVGVVSLVANQPAADVAPVRRGQWKRFNTYMMECTQCGKRVAWHRYYYCPNCGAKMEVLNDD